MIKVSILVPICNVEKFLDKCLKSIVEQTLTDIEIICINDGSKDSSLEIINKFASIDRRIVIIDKPNSGYGDSMNKGLELAKGEYIGIVESDDFVDFNMFEAMYGMAMEYDADIVKSNYNLYWEKSTDVIKYNNNLRIDEVILDTDYAKKRILWRAPAIWSAIYKREFLNENGVRFLATPGASYQDTSFNFKTAALANKIILTPEAYLNYRQDNANSSVKIASKEKVLMVHKEYDEIEKFIEEKELNDLKPVYIVSRFRGYLWNYCRIKKDLQKEYFDIFANELIELTGKNKAYAEKLIRVFGDVIYKSLKTKNKFIFDIALKIYLRKEKTYKSLSKRNLMSKKDFEWL